MSTLNVAEKITTVQAHSIEITDEVFIGSVSDEKMIDYLFYVLDNLPGYEIDSQQTEVEKIGRGSLNSRLTEIWRATTLGFKTR